MMPPGAFSEVSDTALMLAAGAADGLLGAGGRRDELLEEGERLAGHPGDPAERMERPGAVRRDLALELLAGANLVEDLADPLDVLGRERCRRLEQCSELRPEPRRGLLAGDDNRQPLLALHEVVNLELPGALGRGPDAQQVVVGLEGLAEVIAEPSEGLAHARIVGREHGRALGAGRDERAGLLRGHRPVALDRDVGPALEADVEELPLADPHAGLVDEAREVEDPPGREATLAQPLDRETRRRVHP